MNCQKFGLVAFVICTVLAESACTPTGDSEEDQPPDKSVEADRIVKPDTAIPLSKRPPNVLIIQTDDQRPTGSLVTMPATRRIFLNKGTRYTNAVATTPLCCPARTSLLTGQYAHNHGVTDNIDAGPLQARQEQTLQGALHRAGYQTAIVGRLLNGWPIGERPRFFSRWAITGGGYYDAVFDVDGKIVPVATHSTDFIADMASEFWDDFENEDDSPWFVQINTFSPHPPSTTQPRYRDAPIPAWNPNPAVGESDLSDKPPFIQETSNFSIDRGERLRARQLRSLMSVDDLVKQVFSKLKELDETRDTLAFYVSDHGILWGDHGRLWKRTPYVPSTNIPMLVRWPGHFPVESRDGLVANIDLAPTILEAAGIDPPRNWAIDGNSLLDGDARSEVLLEYWKEPDHGFRSWAAIRTEDWIYVEYLSKDRMGVIAREYYDLQADPFQLTNLFRDGIDENDPDERVLHQRLAEAMECKADNCPD
jgi:arylsulfatase A-like enzyme